MKENGQKQRVIRRYYFDLEENEVLDYGMVAVQVLTEEGTPKRYYFSVRGELGYAVDPEMQESLLTPILRCVQRRVDKMWG